MAYIRIYLLIFVFLVAYLQATPSSVFWTNCTTSVYETGTCHIDEDNYFTVFNSRGRGSSFPPDTGVEFGVFTWGDLSAEAGIDYLGGTDDPLYFNAGLGIGEYKLFSQAPSVKIGIFNAGTRYCSPGLTNQNIFDIIIGKTLPDWIGGSFFLGGFIGNRAMGPNKQGFMVAYHTQFCPATHCDGTEYYRWVFCADFASGKNTIGGGGFALGYYFTPDIDILTGPVWFNSAAINGRWKWSVQLDISFTLFDCR